jgi:hypothetical protein
MHDAQETKGLVEARNRACILAFERDHPVAVIYTHNMLWYATSHTEARYLDIVGIGPHGAMYWFKRRDGGWTFFPSTTVEEIDQYVERYRNVVAALREEKE